MLSTLRRVRGIPTFFQFRTFTLIAVSIFICSFCWRPSKTWIAFNGFPTKFWSIGAKTLTLLSFNHPSYCVLATLKMRCILIVDIWRRGNVTTTFQSTTFLTTNWTFIQCCNNIMATLYNTVAEKFCTDQLKSEYFFIV